MTVKLPEIQLVRPSISDRPEEIVSPLGLNDHKNLLYEFLKLQIKERTKQEYSKAIKYFWQYSASSQPFFTFLSDFLILSKREAILMVLRWREQMLLDKKSAATINLRISALKSLVAYAARNELCSYSLEEVKSLPSQAYKDTRGVSAEVFCSIVSRIDRCSDLGIRDYAILRLAWDLGLRRGEISSLDLDDFSGSGRRLSILGKGKIDKVLLELNDGVAAALGEWVGIRKSIYFYPRDGGNQSPALFLSCNGHRLSGTDVYRIVKKYADLVDVDLSPHKIRHSAITALLDANNGNVRAAKSFSRHSKLETVIRYDDNLKDLQGDCTMILGGFFDD